MSILIKLLGHEQSQSIVLFRENHRDRHENDIYGIIIICYVKLFEGQVRRLPEAVVA